MADSFDDFARKHQQEQENRKRLESETKPEWEIMKGFVSQFAADNKGIGGHRFEWELSLTGRHMLRLNNVSALLINDANYGGSERTYGVRFSRRPTGSREVFIDDPPLPAKTWAIEPRILDGDFVWLVDELAREFSSAALADEIAKVLAAYDIEYEAAYGRAV